jgi:glycosyltransferase involved in cell wall biosynthesis
MRPKHRVCHFSSVHHVWDTRVFYRECISLAKEFDVTLIAIGEDGSYTREGVKVIAIAKPKNFFERFFYTVFKVFILAVKQDAQIYHIHDAEMVPFGIILSLLGKSVIYDIHENTHDDILLKPWIRPNIRMLLAKSYNALLWLGSKFLHYIVVVADPRFLPKFFVNEKNATIIQNFANPDDFLPFVVKDRAALDAHHLFYVGMIRDMYYDIDPVLKALVLLKAKGFVCHLHLVGYLGAGKQMDFEKLDFWEEIKDQVTFYGFMETHLAYEISKKCKVGLCIKNQPNSMLVSHERKLFEYMCIGLPSIYCDANIYKDLSAYAEIGIAVNLEHAEEISNAIFSLLTNPSKLNEFSRNNLSLARDYFNWQFEEKKLHQLYYHILRK